MDRGIAEGVGRYMMFSSADRGCWEGMGDVWVLRRYAACACAMEALVGEAGLRRLGVRR